MKLYNPAEGNYNLPIFDTDAAIPSYTWRELIDIYVANNGHNGTVQDFREHISEIMQVALDNAMEEFELCEKEIMKEVKHV